MQIKRPVNHNYYEECPIRESDLTNAFQGGISGSTNAEQLHEIFSTVYELKIGAKQLHNLKLLNFRKSIFKDNEEKLVLKLYAKEHPTEGKQYFVQTGLYAGIVVHKGCIFKITTKYGDAFLKRMLNFVANVYVDNEQFKAKKEDSENQFLFVIAYLFIQSLERAAVLGLPQQYQKQQERGHKVRGSINFNEYLKRDIPFQGKLTSTFRERVYVQEIIDVLYLTLRKLESFFGKEIHGKLLGLNQLLKQHYSGRYATYETIQKAKLHKAIANPLYSSFKKVLEYAEIILLNKDLIPDGEQNNLSTTGFLFDISELFEIYLERLLQKHFPNWTVTGQEELKMYQEQFYGRSMFPDLVMRHKESGKIVVFDAKFKGMHMQSCDVDRTDLHQIHSYSGYYGKKLIISGLIYPLSKELRVEKAHASSLYGNKENETKFIVDGIEVSENHTMEQLIKNEEAFLKRIDAVINTN